MAFDNSTRTRLQKFVSDARKLLSEEYTRQLQNDFGIDPPSGEITELDELTHLDDSKRETARLLRDIINHYISGSPNKNAVEAIDRVIREQAFTTLNRLCALRMAEARDIIIESISKGYQSKGFQLYHRLAGNALGEMAETYRFYLFSLFDELAADLMVLFDRYSPMGRLFPIETTLKKLVDMFNDADLEPLWKEDETIGWIYQYFNSVEERRQMRAESQAPRNSRELAVRNQFFTPRYVVEFLTDNTLGRIWYEMTQGETSLKDNCRYLVRRPKEIFLKVDEEVPKQEDNSEELSQAELLKQPVYIPFRPIKDPREILMLDPACGSMHFGLYAFDLYEQIYAEAWDLEKEIGSNGFIRNDDLKPLHSCYATKDDFLKDVPRLIIEHNIHGIDIDPRAVQIAGLSLYLRAQRSWQQQGVKPAERPLIEKSNIVTAEPMPGEKELLRDFTATLKPNVLGQLLEIIFDKMQLAGEAGSLLKIEEEIVGIIKTAREEYNREQLFRIESKGDLFPETLPKKTSDLFDFTDLSDDEFWQTAEQRILEQLKYYAEYAQKNEATIKRLFADDAARGFAFIDLCRKHYDAVLMNPPFGEPTEQSLPYIEDRFPIAKKNLYIASIVRGAISLAEGGRIGCISDRTYVTHTRYTDFRMRYAVGDGSNLRVTAILDHGWGVLDSYVQTASAVFAKSNCEPLFCVDLKRKEAPDLQLPRIVAMATEGKLGEDAFLHDATALRHLPNGVLAFWMQPSAVRAFKLWPSIDPSFTEARSGLSSSDNERFYKVVWEIPRALLGPERRWSFLSNGGEPCPFYRHQVYVLYFEKNGYMVKALAQDLYRSETRTIKNQAYYRRAGLSYGKRTENFSIQILPPEQLFSNEGHSVFCASDDDALAACAFLNSDFVSYALNCIAGLHKESGYVGNLPFPLDSWLEDGLASRAASKGFRCVATAFRAVPENQFFDVSSLISNDRGLLGGDLSDSDKELSAVLNEINQRVENLLGGGAFLKRRSWQLRKITLSAASSSEATHIRGVDLVGTLTGFTFGRWDIRYATGERRPPELPDPFDPLPVCPPGMLQNAESLPAEPKDVPADYPLRISWPGILVDDENHPEDIVARVREAFEVIRPGSGGSGSRAEVIEQEACEILGVKTLRDYFRRPAAFFADHLKRYSKSRRQAPIYWTLSSSSGHYTLWLYYHRLDDQILYTCVNDFVEPKIKQIDEQVNELQRNLNRSSLEEKELEKLSDFELEIKDFRDELLRIAKFWKPNLNDGVQITAAPLWKLFKLPKWQKTLKSTWEKLEKGEYDWAHLALSIWPERVVKASHKDRSYAIAHDLEEQLWEEIEVSKDKQGNPKYKWQTKELSESELDEIAKLQ